MTRLDSSPVANTYLIGVLEVIRFNIAMPLYDYQCNNCEHIFEVFHGLEGEERAYCPHCTCPQVTRLVSPVAFRCSGNDTAVGIMEAAIKKYLGQNTTKDALRMAEKAMKLIDSHKGISSIKAAKKK